MGTASTSRIASVPEDAPQNDRDTNVDTLIICCQHTGHLFKPESRLVIDGGALGLSLILAADRHTRGFLSGHSMVSARAHILRVIIGHTNATKQPTIVLTQHNDCKRWFRADPNLPAPSAELAEEQLRRLFPWCDVMVLPHCDNLSRLKIFTEGEASLIEVEHNPLLRRELEKNPHARHRADSQERVIGEDERALLVEMETSSRWRM